MLKFLNRPIPIPKLLLLLVLVTSPEVRADFIIHSWENHTPDRVPTQFRLDTLYYNTQQNFDPVGNTVTPTGLSNYYRFQTDLTVEHHFIEPFGAYGRLSWTYLNQDSTILSGNAVGLTDQTLGLFYRVYDPQARHRTSTPPPLFLPVSVDIQLQTDFPAYSTGQALTNQTPFLGDGTVDLTAGVFAQFPLFLGASSRVDAVLGGGYTYRTSGFSSAIPGTLIIKYAPLQDGFFASVATLATFSLKTDVSGTPPNPIRSTAGSGGSEITGGINPSLIQLKGRVGYRFASEIEVALSATQSLWGQDVPNGLNLALGLQIGLGGNDSGKSDSGSNKHYLSDSSEARVLKVNDRMNLIKIDKGSQDGVEVGQIFDIILIKKDGSAGEAIARGKVSDIRAQEAALNITEFYKEVWIEVGYSVKRVNKPTP